MPFRSSPTRFIAAASAIAALALAAGCSKSVDPTTAASIPVESAQAAPAQQPRGTSKLGDLTPFRSIAVDVSAILDQGDLSAAKARIKDLELAWDSAEAGLKPRAADDWHVLDKSIDQALVALRAGSPRQDDCKAAMAQLLNTFDSLQGRS